MKKCTKCLENKLLSDFFVRDKKSGRLHAQCKECYRTQRQFIYKAHYKKYRAEYLVRAKKRRDKLRADFHAKMLNYLSDKSCSQCGESDRRVLEFDHLDQSKKLFTVSQAVRLGYDWQETLQEIQNCRILCANCHKKHTAMQCGWYKSG